MIIIVNCRLLRINRTLNAHGTVACYGRPVSESITISQTLTGEGGGVLLDLGLAVAEFYNFSVSIHSKGLLNMRCYIVAN